MRLVIFTALSTFLLAGAAPVVADTATLLDKGVLVDRNLGDSLERASYRSSGGYAIRSRNYADAAVMSFDMGATSSVSQATLRLPVQEAYALDGAIPLEVYAYADDGQVDFNDYWTGFKLPVASPDAYGVNEVTVDVTGFVNAMLQSGRFVGFRIVSRVNLETLPAGALPAYRGVRFDENRYRLEFTRGAAPVPNRDTPRFDGFKLTTPRISVPGYGLVYTEMQLRDVNQGVFALTLAEVKPATSPVQTGFMKGPDLLDCNAFDPPAPAVQQLSNSAASYSLTAGLLDIPALTYNGKLYSAAVKYTGANNPMLFQLLSIQPIASAPELGPVSVLGGGTTVEPTQDFIPLCHGWVLIGDSSKNRLVERNVITGATGGTYQFNTQPDQLVLDDVNNIVYFSTHPETERLYRLNWDNGLIYYNRIEEGARQFAPRDMVMGEDGNLFAILYDRHQLDAADSSTPGSAGGLWLGLLDPAGNPLRPSIPLEAPVSIEYDPNFRHVFLTTETNLATLEFDPDGNEFTLVEGTDVPVGSGCTDFAVSPDGYRLAYACPNGNNEAVTPLAIHDLDPVDYYNPDGEWYLGAPPVSAIFNRAGELLIATDGQQLYFFDVITHVLLETLDMGLPAGETVRKIRLSRDGEYLLILMHNELSDQNGRIYWLQMPDIEGTPSPW